MDQFVKTVVRRCIINDHISEKSTHGKKCTPNFADSFGFEGSREYLRKRIHSFGFRWTNMKNNRSLLMERHEIKHSRLLYSRNIKKFGDQNKPFIYMVETHIRSCHTHLKGWSDQSNGGLSIRVSKGDRLIIVHSGSENGFVPNADIMWNSQSKTGDYHNEMTYENYEKWA